MQTRTQAHAAISGVVQLAGSAQGSGVVDLAGSAQESPLHGDALPALTAASDFAASASVEHAVPPGHIEHVVLVDLTSAASPGLAGLEGALPSSQLEWLDRLMNVVLASAALLVAAPLMLVVAIAIKLTSRGPVLYAQSRIGLNRRGAAPRADSRRARSQLWAQFLATHDDKRNNDLGGKAFRIYKFRSMGEDAESNTGAVWATRRDPRATRFGAFLRKCRLDELPQLINVIKGDMNIVGPRPERPSIFARMRDAIDAYPLRQCAKPGITGLAQITLFYDSCVDDVRRKVHYDLEYLRRKSLFQDLRIMASTLPVMLFKARGW